MRSSDNNYPETVAVNQGTDLGKVGNVIILILNNSYRDQICELSFRSIVSTSGGNQQPQIEFPLL